MGFFTRIFGSSRDRSALLPLYQAIVAEARQPAWYETAHVPDRMDGRFDMVALVLSLVLLRLEREGKAGQLPSVLLTEVFIDDMDGTMREVGFGDLVVGKRVGGIMGALGGRLGAYREGATDPAKMRTAVIRNLYRDSPPADPVLDQALAMINALAMKITNVPLANLLAGSLA